MSDVGVIGVDVGDDVGVIGVVGGFDVDVGVTKQEGVTVIPHPLSPLALFVTRFARLVDRPPPPGDVRGRNWQACRRRRSGRIIQFLSGLAPPLLDR